MASKFLNGLSVPAGATSTLSGPVALTASSGVTGFADKGGQVYNVKAYGAAGDSGYGQASATGTALVAQTALFVTDGSDVGRAVMVCGAGASGKPFFGTIASVTSVTAATLTGAVTANVTTRTVVVYRTDDTNAFKLAAQACSASYGGCVFVPTGVYNATAALSDVTNLRYVRLAGVGTSSVIAPPQDGIGVFCFALTECEVRDLKIVGGRCGIFTDSNHTGRYANLILADQYLGTTGTAPPWDGDGFFLDGDASTEITLSDIRVDRAMGSAIHYWRGTTQDNGGFYLHDTSVATGSIVGGAHGLFVQGSSGGKGYAPSQTNATGTVVPHPRNTATYGTAASGMTLTFNTDGAGVVTGFTVNSGTGYTRAPYLMFGGTPTVPAGLKPYSGSGGATVPVQPVSGGYASLSYTTNVGSSGCFTFATNLVCDGYADTLTPASGSAVAVHSAANVRLTNAWATGAQAGGGAVWLWNASQSMFANLWPQNGNSSDTTAAHVKVDNTSHDLVFNGMVLPKSCAYGFSLDGTNYNVELGNYTSDVEQRTSPSNGLLANDFTQLVAQGAGAANYYRYSPPPTFLTDAAMDAKSGAVGFYDATGAAAGKKFLRVNTGSLEFLSDNQTQLAKLSDAGYFYGKFLDQGGAWVNVKSYGAAGDGSEASDGAATAGGATLTCASSAPFLPADTGRNVLVVGAAAGGANLYTTMTYSSATVATLAVNASTTVAGATVIVYRTDDSAAFSNAVNAVSGGGVVFVPAGVYSTNVPVSQKNDVSVRGTGKASVLTPKAGVGLNFYGCLRCDATDLRVIGGNTGMRVNSDTLGRFSNLFFEGQRKSASAVSVTAATAAGAAATFTAAGHGLVVGDWTTVAGVTPAAYNGVWQVTAVAGTTFSATLASSPGGAGTVFGTSTGPFDDGAGVFVNGDGGTEVQFEGVDVRQPEGHGVWYDRPSNSVGADGGGCYFRGVIVSRSGAANTLSGNGFRVNSQAGSPASDFLWFEQCVADGFNDVCWYLNNTANFRCNQVWATTGTTGVASKGAFQLTNASQGSVTQAWVQNKVGTGYGLELVNTCTQLTLDNLELVGVSGGVGIQFTGSGQSNLQFGAYTAEGGLTALGPSLQAANAQAFVASSPSGTTGHLQPKTVLVNGGGGQAAAFSLQDTASGSTPKKYLRVASGNLELLNDAFSRIALWADGGRLTLGNAGSLAGELAIATNSGSNPTKYLRVNTGNLQFMNSAYTAPLVNVTDAGDLAVGTNVAAISGANPAYSLHVFGGQARVQAVATPGAPTLGTVTNGAAGSYWYWVVAEDAQGNKTLPSPSATTAVGPTTFDGTHTVALTYNLVAGAVKHYLLRTATSPPPSGTVSAVVAANTALYPFSAVPVTDNVAAGSLTSITLPARNATADATFDGAVTFGAQATTPNAAAGAAYFDATRQTLGFGLGAAATPANGYVPAVLYTATADATSNSNATTSLIGTGVGSLTLPAAFFVAGKAVRLRARGYLTTAASPSTLVFQVNLTNSVPATVTVANTNNGTALAPVASMAVAKLWEMECDVTCRTTGSSGTVMATGRVRMNAATATGFGAANVAEVMLASTATPAAATVNTTLTQAVEFKAVQATNTASTVVCNAFTVEALN